MKIYEKRIDKLREKMIQNGWDAVYLGPGSDLQYIVGVMRGMNNPTDNNMHGEEVYGAFINQTDVIFVIPHLAIIASEFGSPIDNMPWITEQILLRDEITPIQTAKIVFEKLNNPSVIAMNARAWVRNSLMLKKALPAIKICDASFVIAEMRSIKDEYEIEQMRGAGRLTDIVFGEVLKRMRVGMTELDIMEEISHQCFINGGSGMSFHTETSIRGKKIKASFYDGGFPRTILQPGAVVSFDFGVIYNGYASDFGRTVFVGDPEPLYIRYHDAVMETQKIAIDSMKSGKITAATLDYESHKHMEDLGLGDMFIHRLGHGVGIDVHETPYAYPGDDTVLMSGMTMAIEPSCYKPGVIGVRVEDVVLVGPDGGETLSNFSRELLII